MAPYVEVTGDDGIEAEFKGISFTASGAVLSSARVAAIRTEEEAILNGVVGQVYQIPIAASASEAFAIMRGLSRMSVKARIVDILAVKTGNPDTEQGSPSEDLRTRVSDMLKLILDKSMELPGATPIQSGGAVHSYTAENDLQTSVRLARKAW